ncbi:MAG: hybrid sensor histidine kinase/response regulator [Candidatus Desulfacyla sp.]
MEKVLLIDDERPLLEMLEISLRSDGYTVFTAENGAAGLDIFEKEKPELVVTDIKMPGLDGLEVLKRIRESGQEVEVIVITGHGDMGTSIAALQLGASDYITKPVREAALTLALERARNKLAISRRLREYTSNLEQMVETRTAELKAAQQELLRNERLTTIGETVTGLAHYIKNILNGLRGGMYKINSAVTRDDKALLKDGWDMANRNLEKISQLVLDLLSYSRGASPQYKAQDPGLIIQDVVESLQHRADETNVRLSCVVDENSVPVVLDPDGIYRALLNLVANAIEACIYDPDRSKRFEVIVKWFGETDENGGETLVLEVSDNGCGMSEHVKGSLFTRFFSTKGEHGTGIGLLITQKIIQEHGGAITVESREGEGTRFQIRLPFNRKAS